MSGYPVLKEGQSVVQAAKVAIGTDKKRLKQETVRRLFDYNPETGIMTRLISTSNAARAGAVVGKKLNRGYYTVRVGDHLYFLHRIIWLWWYGYFPENHIDHINRVTTDNRICNLREVSASCNIRNSKTFTTNTSGIRGVTRYNRDHCWVAKITVNRKSIRLKQGQDLIELAAYRLAAEQCLGFEVCNSETGAMRVIMEYVNRDKTKEIDNEYRETNRHS